MSHDPHPFTAATDKFAYAQAFSRTGRAVRGTHSSALDRVALLLRRRTR
jgi:hypothetical protein